MWAGQDSLETLFLMEPSVLYQIRVRFKFRETVFLGNAILNGSTCFIPSYWYKCWGTVFIGENISSRTTCIISIKR